MKVFIKVFLLICGILCFAINGFAWDATGHRVIAQIAYDNLTPHAKHEITKLFQVIREKYPKNYNMVTSAAWMDSFKTDCPKDSTNCLLPPKTWHYMDRPYRIGSDVDLDMAAKEYVRAPNVVWAIEKSVAEIQSPHNSYKVKGLYLLFLIHLVGDVYQPLHNILGISSQFPAPEGDAGGNAYKIQFNKICRLKDMPFDVMHDIGSLHTFWDQGAGEFTCVPIKNGWGGYVDSLAKYYEHRMRYSVKLHKKIRKLLRRNKTPQSWSLESYKYARQAYDTPFGGQVSVTYVEKSKKIVDQQIILAGYRLAQVLNHIFS